MKPFIVAAIFAVIALQAQAQDRWLYWKYKDYGQLNFAIPRVVFQTGSLFVNNCQERKMVRRIHKVRTMIFEDGSPITERDMRKFNRRAQRRHLDEIITVREGKTRVQVMAKERRGKLRKFVVFVNSPEDGFFLISVKGKLRLDDLNGLIKKYGKDKGDINIPGIKSPTEEI